MSWQATAWAKSTRGHRNYSDKLMLMTIADYHDQERGVAWPSQRTLSADCEMPERTVRACLRSLEKNGFVTTIAKGNQYKPTIYRLNFETATAQSCEPAESGPAIIAAAKCTGSMKQVNRQYDASEPAVPATTSTQST